ncbi:ABC transporter permease [Limoniibacter endophyticus]|nr:ABC transporter permease [Limoniibacter endophyticus]
MPKLKMGGLISELRLAWRFALREMRGGLKGFYIFIGCIALGVAAIGAVHSVASAIKGGLDSQGAILLGGDIRLELNQRQATEPELAFLREYGTVAEGASMRSMARLTDGSNQALVEAKSIDPSYYPLYGLLETQPTRETAELFGQQDGVYGAVAPDILLQRLGVSVGDEILLGRARFQIRSMLIAEPDAASEGFGFAPRLLISNEALVASGLNQPGAMIEFSYKIRLSDPSAAALAALSERATHEFASSGWSVRTRDNASPALRSNVDRFSQFLALVGLTSLVVGGVGVANAVRAYMDSKRPVIATFKSLGASGHLIFLIYITQVVLVSLIAIAIGLGIAAIAPPLLKSALQTFIPVPLETGIYPGALALAFTFGILVTLVFTILPLGRAREIPAASLFRSMGLNMAGRPRRSYFISAAVIALGLAVLAIYLSSDRRLGFIFVASTLLAFIVLRQVAHLIEWIARRAPHSRSTPLRLAVGNIHRPGALTPSVVLSLGLGLTLLVALGLIDANLRNQITSRLPQQAPNFFFVDIQSSEVDRFSRLVSENAPEGALMRVPMLRGRITALNGTQTADLPENVRANWVMRGDRGITYEPDIPENSVLTQGEWWPKDYSGEPLVSFVAEEAREIGLDIGDTITVNVLGREITARVASLREVKWESLGINFVMVFSPNSFAGAPHAWLATLSDDQATPQQEGRILNAVTRTFPTVTTVRVKDALDVVNDLIRQLAAAVRAAASVAIVASVLVLAGALAASNRARVHDAVVLKTIGATRHMLMRAYVLEYALIGAAASIFALLAGAVAAWFVLTQVMAMSFTLFWQVAAATLVFGLVLTVALGLAGTWRILGLKAAPILRGF